MEGVGGAAEGLWNGVGTGQALGWKGEVGQACAARGPGSLGAVWGSLPEPYITKSISLGPASGCAQEPIFAQQNDNMYLEGFTRCGG
jgi:hypothetical protein